MKLIQLPREHGAYVVLGSSWLVGIVRAGSIDPIGVSLLLLTIFGALVAQNPIKLIARGKLPADRAARRGIVAVAGILAMLTAGSGLGAAIRHPEILWLLPPTILFAAIYLRLEQMRASMRNRSLAAFLALTLAAPASRIAAGEGWSVGELAGLWLTAALFFCGAVYCVTIRLAGNTAVRPAIVYHLAAVAVAMALWWSGILELASILVLALALLKLAWIVLAVDRYRAMPLKQIGIQESIVSIAFILINLTTLTP